MTPTADTPRPDRDASLLIVDDDVSAIHLMSRMLTQYPNQRFATSGAEAIRLARESKPDLILLDVDMPGMSGLDVCKALKADPELAQVPVIFATSHAAPPLELSALELGAADFVRKPLVAAQLAARVRAQLRRRSEARPAAAAPARLPRLLIVDDDADAIRVLRAALGTLGEFHFAHSGDEALRLARRLAPDLILLDGRMPGMDGYEVCEALRDEAAFQHVPIVFVTGFADPQNERRAFDLGAADFIAKPYLPDVVQARVRNLLDLKRRTDERLQAVHDHWRRVSNSRIADIVRAAPEAIVVHDDGGRLMLANAAACRLFDKTLDALLGHAIQDLIGAEAWGRLAAHGPPTPATRIALARADAPPMPVEASVSAVGDGAERLTTVILRDVSDRERLEAESRARAEAEAASRTKTLMLSYLAHEIGNPLNGILGFAQLMAADAGQPLPPNQARRLAHVMTSGRHLQSLLRDLLDLGSLESGRLAVRLRPLAVGAAIGMAATAVAALAGQSAVILSCVAVPPEAQLTGDPDRLHQCLINLLTNAIKYNRAGGWVRIEVDCRADEVEIAVRDNGLGLTPAQCAHLFEPFNRLGRSDGTAPGSGLGLMVTRQLVEAMHGTLRVESTPHQGSRFAIVLPRSPSGIGTRAPAPRHHD